MEEKSFITDIAVAIVFFNRPKSLSETFAAVATARPSRLYLIQDGARDNRPSDNEKVQQCREIVSHVDWDCKVTEIFSPKNLGCGMRMFSGLSEAFDKEDFLVVIEDDIVIGKDFLPFCKEMSERYHDDERIGRVCGMNHIGEYKECPNSYFFSSRGGSCWGWATWKRVWKDIEWDFKCADDKYIMDIYPLTAQPHARGESFKKMVETRVASMKQGKKQSSWSVQFIFTACFLQNRLTIVPQKNLISNIGLGEENVHSTSSICYIPRGLRKVYYGKKYDLPQPYKHPKYVVDDFRYIKGQDAVMGASKSATIYRRIEAVVYKLLPFLGK